MYKKRAIMRGIVLFKKQKIVASRPDLGEKPVFVRLADKVFKPTQRLRNFYAAHLLRAVALLGIQGQFEKALANFLRVVLRGRNCAIAVAGNKELYVHYYL